MHKVQYSKEELKIIVEREQKSFCVPLEMLVKYFGTITHNDESMFLHKVIYPSLSYERLTTLPLYDFKRVVEDWCINENIFYHFDDNRRMYTFTKQLKPQQL